MNIFIISFDHLMFYRIILFMTAVSVFNYFSFWTNNNMQSLRILLIDIAIAGRTAGTSLTLIYFLEFILFLVIILFLKEFRGLENCQ